MAIQEGSLGVEMVMQSTQETSQNIIPLQRTEHYLAALFTANIKLPLRSRGYKVK